MMASRMRPRRCRDAADAAREARAAEDDRGEHVELLADQDRRRHGLGELRLDERSDAGREAHIAVDSRLSGEG